MGQFGKVFAIYAFFFVIFGGIVIYGLIKGVVPTKSGPSRRNDGQVSFYCNVGLYACVALLPFLGLVDTILQVNHHKGLWMRLLP
jgi:hypothetical protein